MREAFPLVGLDHLRFGMTPAQVRSLYGDSQRWETWMGGNLNDFMFYEGLLIGFDGDNADVPQETSSVVLLGARTESGMKLFDVDISTFAIEKLLGFFVERSIATVQTRAHFFRVPSLGIQFNVGREGYLEELWLTRADRVRTP
jgi:hypothetical protein